MDACNMQGSVRRKKHASDKCKEKEAKRLRLCEYSPKLLACTLEKEALVPCHDVIHIRERRKDDWRTVYGSAAGGL